MRMPLSSCWFKNAGRLMALSVGGRIRALGFMAVAVLTAVQSNGAEAKGVCVQPVPRAVVKLLERVQASSMQLGSALGTVNYLVSQYCLDQTEIPITDMTENVGSGCTMQSGLLNRERVYWADCSAGSLAALIRSFPAAIASGSSPGIGTGGPFVPPTITPALATPPPGRWKHNDSVVALNARENDRTFVYQEPRPGMAAQGVKPGETLFVGKFKSMRYEGVAYIFSKKCGKKPYQVSGPVSSDYREVILSGKAPRFGTNCEDAGSVDDVLRFVWEEL